MEGWTGICRPLRGDALELGGRTAEPAARRQDARVAEGIAGGTEIEVVGTSAPAFSARVSDAGRKLLIDITNADVIGAPEAITRATGPVGGVLTHGHANTSPVAAATVSPTAAARIQDWTRGR